MTELHSWCLNPFWICQQEILPCHLQGLWQEQDNDQASDKNKHIQKIYHPHSLLFLHSISPGSWFSWRHGYNPMCPQGGLCTALRGALRSWGCRSSGLWGTSLQLQEWWSCSTTLLLPVDADVSPFSPYSARHLFLPPFLYWSQHGTDPATSQTKELNRSEIIHTNPK